VGKIEGGGGGGGGGLLNVLLGKQMFFKCCLEDFKGSAIFQVFI
jgi:hypothetical protein